MKTNSLAFRLFVTAAAWVLVVLPVAGWIIFSRYHHEAITTFDTRISFFLTVVISDADEHSEAGPNAPNNWGEGLFEITHSGWYWQIKPLDGKPGTDAALALACRRHPGAAERAQDRAQRKGDPLGQPDRSWRAARAHRRAGVCVRRRQGRRSAIPSPSPAS